MPSDWRRSRRAGARLAAQCAGEGSTVMLATSWRDGDGDLILFLHGLGCVKENFARLWDAPELRGAALLAPDLPGHGASQGLPPEAWTMEGMTASVRGLLRDRGLDSLRLHVVAHSMGGAVEVLLAEPADLQVASFVNIEGNLVAADCGLLSRRVAESDLDDFRREKLPRLKARAREAADPITRDWAEWVDACPAEALHASARSLVAWSDGGRLLAIFRGLAAPTAYVHGAHSANPDVLVHLQGVPTYEIAGSGHFPMIDHAADLAGVIGTVLAQAGQRAA